MVDNRATDSTALSETVGQHKNSKILFDNFRIETEKNNG